MDNYTRGKYMSTLLVKVRAKLNLSLNVLGVLENNYHDLDMVICPISMQDDIILEKAQSGIDFKCSDKQIENKKNLVYKATERIFEYAKIDAGTHGVKIHLSKRIWMQAGLGGGSANAAGVLLGINQLYDLNLSKNELSQIAIKLGADVPLFLNNGLTRVQGIGERVEYFPFDTKLHLLILQDEIGLPTQSVFKMYDNNPCRKRTDNANLINAVQANDINDISKNMHNCLQSTAIIMNDSISQGLDYLKRYGAVKAMMTGSGSAVYGIFTDRKSAKEAENIIKTEYKNCVYAQTESEYINIQEF